MLVSVFRLGVLKLLPNDLSHWQSCPLRHFLEPGQELV